MKTILLYFSDIHLTGNKPENEGAVIKAFCEDVKLQLTNLTNSSNCRVSPLFNADCYRCFERFKRFSV